MLIKARVQIMGFMPESGDAEMVSSGDIHIQSYQFRLADGELPRVLGQLNQLRHQSALSVTWDMELCIKPVKPIGVK